MLCLLNNVPNDQHFEKKETELYIKQEDKMHQELYLISPIQLINLSIFTRGFLYTPNFVF